jgi:hypothetical protein
MHPLWWRPEQARRTQTLSDRRLRSKRAFVTHGNSALILDILKEPIGRQFPPEPAPLRFAVGESAACRKLQAPIADGAVLRDLRRVRAPLRAASDHVGIERPGFPGTLLADDRRQSLLLLRAAADKALRLCPRSRRNWPLSGMSNVSMPCRTTTSMRVSQAGAKSRGPILA